LIIYDTNRDLTTKVVLKFAQGCSQDKNLEVRFQKIDKYRKTGFDRTLRPGIDAVASLGVLRGTGEMFHDAAAYGIDYYYMDHAYYNPGYGGPGWMRIVKNGHTMNWLKPHNGKRYLKYFKGLAPIESWKSNSERGDRIVVCPPTNAVSWYAKLSYDWTENVVSQLKSLLPESQHNRILVRPKPNEPMVDDAGNLIGFRQNASEGSLDQDLANAQCVVAFNSMVALTATLKGIPVIGGDYNCCKPIAYKIHDIATPVVFDHEPVDRTNLVHWLAENQWNAQEIQNGVAWQNLQEIYCGI
jgi:hypothetical protein